MNRLIVTFFALMATVAGVALAADAKAGADVFNKSCKMCHGEGGATPNPQVAKMFGVPIPVLGSPAIQAKSDADFRKVITEGKGKMPIAKNVTGGAIDDVIAYLRTLKP
jgi:mono/diheme cytochrome c family protein